MNTFHMFYFTELSLMAPFFVNRLQTHWIWTYFDFECIYLHLEESFLAFWAHFCLFRILRATIFFNPQRLKMTLKGRKMQLKKGTILAFLHEVAFELICQHIGLNTFWYFIFSWTNFICTWSILTDYQTDWYFLWSSIDQKLNLLLIKRMLFASNLQKISRLASLTSDLLLFLTG